MGVPHDGRLAHSHMHAITYPTIITVFRKNKLLYIKNYDIKNLLTLKINYEVTRKVHVNGFHLKNKWFSNLCEMQRYLTVIFLFIFRHQLTD